MNYDRRILGKKKNSGKSYPRIFGYVVVMTALYLLLQLLLIK